MGKIQNLTGDMIKATFWIFILTLMYALFFYEVDADSVKATKNKTVLSMEDAITMIDNNLSIKKETLSKITDISKKRASSTIEILKSVYHISVVKKEQRYITDKSYEVDTENKDIEKRITLSFVHKTAEVYTNPYASEDDYFSVCSAMFMAFLDAGTSQKKMIEDGLLSGFRQVSQITHKKTEFRIYDVVVTIAPDSQGNLGCEFYKN